ncbi:putative lipid II flippase FtsW [Bifidobacterium amazonense]|uniref:Probable peptidoglycan glycosyltransferase FtsW n=1 Tax=Bifidobacterium amazonense TaxID=2809027 RepID=A0ABS9VRH3_9BIFI|nr:putative peptidoglycan glycosyltransferase FtsW [Bifidobacterium amazonense]MCH9274723.1 putative lipid II flippase FtsW [Bifidobacterium amazonense]
MPKARRVASSDTTSPERTRADKTAGTPRTAAGRGRRDDEGPRAGRGTASPAARRGASGDDFAGFTGLASLFNPLWCYHGFIVAVLALSVFGVIMVFSSSSVSMVANGYAPWKQAVSQGVYCVGGLVCALVLSRCGVRLYRRVGIIAVFGAMFLQFLTLTPLGIDVDGNRGWIGIPGVLTFQPAEMIKLSLCIWLPGALQMAAKRFRREGWKAYAVPGGVYASCLGLVLLGKDLGTAMIIVFIGVVAFMISGFPLKYMAMLAGGLAVLVLVLVVTSPNRLRRVFAAYSCSDADTQGVCFQSVHARYALSSGGLLGVGLGNSREKWSYLPAAHNDFIFAIIGEETGFVGTMIVVLLFVTIGWCLLVVALQIKDRYVSMVLMCVMIWIVGQALVNIGVVVGLFPVLGVPMPFVSAGGSSMLMCLSAAGVAVGMMRSQPQIRAESRSS